MRKILALPLLFLLLLSVAAGAQTQRIAQLKANVQSAATPGKKQEALLALCDQGYTLHPDSLMAFASQVEALAKQTGNRSNEIEARFYRSFALTNKGLIDSSLALAESCEAVLQKELHDPVLKANVLNQKGRCYMRKNRYKEAISMAYGVIDNAEKGGDVLLQIKGKTLMGWAYLEMGQSAEALRWHLNALHTTNDEKILEQYGILFANLALNYSALKKPDSAFYYIEKAVAYSRKSENLFALSNSLAIEAQLYVNTGQSPKAEALLKEVIQIRQLIGDPFYIVSDMAQLAFYYASNSQSQKGLALATEGLDLAHRYNINTKFFLLYSALAANYKAAGNLSAYAGMMDKIVAWKDSVYQANSAEALAEIQTKYNLQKKENIIIQQKFDLVRENYWLYGSLLVFFLIAAAAFLLYRADKRKQQLKLQLMQEEEKRKAERAITEAEEAERKRIAADLHDSLGAYAASIAANIDQIDAQLPAQNKSVLQELRTNARTIVAQLNDTIWVLKKDALTLTAIADRLKIFIQRLQSSYPQVLIDVEEAVEQDFLLGPSQAFHLFQIIKEAVINALKHSHCTQLTIHIEAAKDWQFSIADNGNGFLQKTTLAEGGNGLVNMRQRARDSGYSIHWTQNSPTGTKVIIEPTTN
jgi:signal transduction histidine kinase